jgi:hypothetical protein
MYANFKDTGITPLHVTLPKMYQRTLNVTAFVLNVTSSAKCNTNTANLTKSVVLKVTVSVLNVKVYFACDKFNSACRKCNTQIIVYIILELYTPKTQQVSPRTVSKRKPRT